MTRTDANPWAILAGLTLGVLVTNGFARFAYGLILPAMRDDLGWTYAQAGWLNTANALGYVLGALATLALAGRVAPQRLFALGLAATAVGLVATGLGTGLGWQSMWRFLTGVFGALSFSTAGALAAGLWPGDARKNAMGIAILFGTGGGSAIWLAGATIPPWLAVQGPGAWPWAWVGVGALSLACVVPGLWAARAVQVGAGAPPPGPPRPLPWRAMLPELVGYASFGLGYFVYLTFLSALMVARGAGAGQIVLVWVTLGAAIALSPFLWRGVFARHADGRPLAMVLAGIAFGSVLPVVWTGAAGMVASALVFGAAVFMAPGAVTNFARQNLPQADWARAIGLFTVVFALAQTLGPYAAGWLGDWTGDIGTGFLAAAAALSLGALAALGQRRLG